jgi:hypothetical protein
MSGKHRRSVTAHTARSARQLGVAHQTRMPADRISERCRWVIGHAERSSRSQVGGVQRALIRAWGVPVDQAAAGDLRAGDVVPFEDPNLKARRVERVVLVVGRVVVPLGLDVADAVRVTLAVDSLLARLGKAAC